MSNEALPENLLSMRQPAGGMLRATPPEPREPMLRVAEELFRYIYTRAAVSVGEVLVVSSAIPGEGKSVVSLGLAVTIAQDFPNRRVLLVEAELERPILARDFELDPAPGLTEVLHGEQALEVAVRPSHLENLDLLPAGEAGTRSGRVLRSMAMVTVVETLRQSYDMIILDAPSVLTNSDAVILSDLADGVIFVVRAGVTPTSMVNKAIEQLDETKVRGIVVNDSKSAVPGWVRRFSGSDGLAP